ncbi:protoporphyrinogen oxidase HemJ [Helicobacter suis]|uniref:protoporphyrinogen oxidase HemJ n=1 Tax=Helicobacter suis TaxID=104628 RepID=UPI00196799FE|nr:protoporphyrinogen oxidase HemJ [Helicobacter suis]
MQVYLWLKMLHIVAIISWMAALLYLPRLLVYHRENYDKPEFVAIVQVQESKLFNAIATPAMIISVLSGLGLIYVLNPAALFSHGWLHLKLLFVLVLLHFHFMCKKWMRELKKEGTYKSSRFFRFANEVPTICMIVIVFAVVGKFF